MLYITLRQYEYICAVAEAGSLREAALRLNVSQPSLSVAISRVEARLGQPVFCRRKGAGVIVTPFGHAVVAKAQDLLNAAQAIENHSQFNRPFVLGCFEDVAPNFLALALARLQSDFPEVAFKGREGRFVELAKGLSSGKIDLAISYDVGFEGHFERRKICDVAPVAFVSADHALSDRPELSLDELVNYPLILFEEDHSEGFVQSLFHRVGLRPAIAHRVRSLEMMRSFAAHGAGIGLSYSRPPGDQSYDSKPVSAITISTPEARAEISLIWSSFHTRDADFEAIMTNLFQENWSVPAMRLPVQDRAKPL